jgi:hypothetical protein
LWVESVEQTGGVAGTICEMRKTKFHFNVFVFVFVFFSSKMLSKEIEKKSGWKLID